MRYALCASHFHACPAHGGVNPVGNKITKVPTSPILIILTKGNRLKPKLACKFLSLNMDMLWFVTVEVVKEKPVSPTDILNRWHQVPPKGPSSKAIALLKGVIPDSEGIHPSQSESSHIFSSYLCLPRLSKMPPRGAQFTP
jgi:hypothetical protein